MLADFRPVSGTGRHDRVWDALASMTVAPTALQETPSQQRVRSVSVMKHAR
jgi:hypothetical protein